MSQLLVEAVVVVVCGGVGARVARRMGLACVECLLSEIRVCWGFAARTGVGCARAAGRVPE